MPWAGPAQRASGRGACSAAAGRRVGGQRLRALGGFRRVHGIQEIQVRHLGVHDDDAVLPRAPQQEEPGGFLCKVFFLSSLFLLYSIFYSLDLNKKELSNTN